MNSINPATTDAPTRITVVPPEVFEAKRRERERQRRERRAYAGSILEAPDETEHRMRVASKSKEPTQ